MKVGSGVETLKEKVGDAVVKTKHVASETLQSASDAVSETADSIQATLENTSRKLRKDDSKNQAKQNDLQQQK